MPPQSLTVEMPDPADMVERYVLVDIYAWTTPLPRFDGRTQHNVAHRGDIVRVTAEEAARGEGMDPPALGTSLEAVTAGSTAVEPGSAVDEELRGMNVEDLVSYLGAHPSEAERIGELEAQRDRPRKGVTEAVDRVTVARDEALAARAAELEANATPAGPGAPTLPA